MAIHELVAMAELRELADNYEKEGLRLKRRGIGSNNDNEHLNRSRELRKFIREMEEN